MTAQALPADTARRSLSLQPGLAIVKLGGSVVRSPELSAWLDVIAACPRPIIVVPGGGALADEVRAAQTTLGFGDGAAHRMALLAMDQLAWAIAGLRDGFEVGDTEAALHQTLGQGRVAVWAPYSLVAGRSDIPQSWTVTSDSLALWLGRRLGAECCYVIKSIERSRGEFSAKQLASDGVVDEEDYVVWRRNYGRSITVATGGGGWATVPEPPGGLLVVSTIAIYFVATSASRT